MLCVVMPCVCVLFFPSSVHVECREFGSFFLREVAALGVLCCFALLFV